MKLLLTITFIILLTSLYVNWNLFSKLEKYEETFDTYDDFISKKVEAYKLLLEKMREIDSRQMFEKDDDVGSIFQKLKELIEDYENFE